MNKYVDRINNILGENGTLHKNLHGYEVRDEQIAISSEIYKALGFNYSLLIEGETGVGKSLAYLIPIVLQRNKKIVISTGSKNLQEQLYYKDVPLVQKYIDKNFSPLYIKGRNNYLCMNRVIELEKELTQLDIFHDSELSEIITWSKSTETGDVSELKSVHENSDIWKRVLTV